MTRLKSGLADRSPGAEQRGEGVIRCKLTERINYSNEIYGSLINQNAE